MRASTILAAIAAALLAGPAMAKHSATHDDMDTCSRDQKGDSECSNDHSYIVTCGSDRHWHKTTDCGNVRCGSNYTGYSVCGGETMGKRDEAPTVDETLEKRKAHTHNDMDTCNRNQKGNQQCSNDYSYIVTCDADRHWHRSATCAPGAGNGCMLNSDGPIYCGEFLGGGNYKRNEDAGDELEKRKDKTHNDGDTCNRDQKGDSQCNNAHDAIVTCQGDRHWRTTTKCGAAGCSYGYGGFHADPICGQADIPDKRDVADPAGDDGAEYVTETITYKVKRRAPTSKPTATRKMHDHAQEHEI